MLELFLLLLLQLLQLHICSCCVWSLFLVSSSSFLKSKSLSAFSRRYTMVSDALALFLGVAPPSSSPFLFKVLPSFSMDSFLISSAFFLSSVLLLSACFPLSPVSLSLSSNLSIICSSNLSISDISGEIPLAYSSSVIFFLYFLERRAYRSLTALFCPSRCAKAS